MNGSPSSSLGVERPERVMSFVVTERLNDGSAASSSPAHSSGASSPLLQAEDEERRTKRMKKKSKETRVKAEVRQWMKSTVVSGIVESSLALAIKKKKPVKMSTAAVAEVRRKRMLAESYKNTGGEAIGERRHQDTNLDERSQESPQNTIEDGFEPVTSTRSHQHAKASNSQQQLSSGLSETALTQQAKSNANPPLTKSLSASKAIPARSSQQQQQRSGSDRNMTILRRANTPKNGHQQLEQWPRAKEVPKRILNSHTASTATGRANTSTRPSPRSWASAVSGIDTSQHTSQTNQATTTFSDKINHTTTSDTQPTPPQNRKLAPENAWNTKPKGALAAAAAAIVEARTKEAAATGSSSSREDEATSMSNGDSCSDDRSAATTAVQPEQSTPGTESSSTNSPTSSMEAGKSTISKNAHASLSIDQNSSDKTNTLTKTAVEEADSKQTQTNEPRPIDAGNDQRRHVWVGQLPASLRAPPQQGQQATTNATQAAAQQSTNSAQVDKEQQTKARNDAEGAAYSARRASVGRQTEEERQRQMDECFDSTIQAERVAHRAWAAAGVEESHERRSSERASKAGAVRRRLAKDIDAFIARLDAAMAPQRLARAAVLASVSDVVKAMWGPHVDCALYGSCLTGLDLPSSDVDIVVRGLGFCATPLVSVHSPLHTAAAPVISGFHPGLATAPMMPTMGLELPPGGSSVRSASPTPSSRGSNERRSRQAASGGAVPSGRNQYASSGTPQLVATIPTHQDAAAAAAAAAVAADAYYYQHGVVYMPYYAPVMPQMTGVIPVSSHDSICATEESDYGGGHEEEDLVSEGDANSSFGQNNSVGHTENGQHDAENAEEESSSDQNPNNTTLPNGHGVPPYLQMPPPRSVGNSTQPNAYAAAFVPPSVPSPLYRQQQLTPNRTDMTRHQYPLRSPTPPVTAPIAVIQCLKALAQALSAQPWVKELKCIETASIPVIKLLAKPALLDPPAPLPAARRTRPRPVGEATSADLESVWGGALGRSDEGLLAVDISFEAPNHGGLASSRYALEAMQRWPEAAPLMLVLKELLVQRGLNEPFTGGLSSYSLLLLIITTMLQAGVTPLDGSVTHDEADEFHHQHRQRIRTAAISGNTSDNNEFSVSLARRIRDSRGLGLSEEDDDDALGYLLMYFFDLFGRQFDPASQAISVLRGDRGIIYLNQHGLGNDSESQQTVTPIIEDPLECTRNVARSCFGIAQIQHVFAHCSSLLEIRGTAAAVRDEHVLPLLLNY